MSEKPTKSKYENRTDGGPGTEYQQEQLEKRAKGIPKGREDYPLTEDRKDDKPPPFIDGAITSVLGTNPAYIPYEEELEGVDAKDYASKVHELINRKAKEDAKQAEENVEASDSPVPDEPKKTQTKKNKES